MKKFGELLEEVVVVAFLLEHVLDFSEAVLHEVPHRYRGREENGGLVVRKLEPVESLVVQVLF